MVAVLVCIPTNSDSYTHFTLFQGLPHLRLQSTTEFVVFVLAGGGGGGGRFLMYVCVCVGGGGCTGKGSLIYMRHMNAAFYLLTSML